MSVLPAALSALTLLSTALTLAYPSTSIAGAKPLSRVRHLTRVKIIESNNVSIRPGSIYDNITYFELFLKFPFPVFNYEFIDTGLGSAEPLYPMLQHGHQGSWFQLLPAFVSEEARHIDHFSSLPTVEGCMVDSLYMLRNIKEFPDHLYQEEREEGYPLIVIRLEHYTKIRPNAQCGRHVANAPDPDFDPMQWMKEQLDKHTLAEMPQEDLKRFEAKVSAIRHIEQRFIKGKEMPLFDEDLLSSNSLWYYPDGVDLDYGHQQVRPQKNMQWLNQAKDLIVTPSAAIQEHFSLNRRLDEQSHQKLMNMLQGEPVPGHNLIEEPGGDTLRLEDVQPKHIYTAGLRLESIQDVYSDVSNPEHFRLVGMTIRPYEKEEDILFSQPKEIPQIRMVYQLMNPRDPNEAFEQLYYHLNYDAIDRLSPPEEFSRQQEHFLAQLDELIRVKNWEPERYDDHLMEFLLEFTSRPLENLAFSSSLTGIWIFGALTTSHNRDRILKPVWIEREGIPIGYYSSAFDNDLFRQRLALTDDPEEKEKLEEHLDFLTVEHYRDPRRDDPHRNNFHQMTCAQCHQLSGRDAVHMALNDHLDRRFTDPMRFTKFVLMDLDAQLEAKQKDESQ